MAVTAAHQHGSTAEGLRSTLTSLREEVRAVQDNVGDISAAIEGTELVWEQLQRSDAELDELQLELEGMVQTWHTNLSALQEKESRALELEHMQQRYVTLQGQLLRGQNVFKTQLDDLRGLNKHLEAECEFASEQV